VVKPDCDTAVPCCELRIHCINGCASVSIHDLGKPAYFCILHGVLASWVAVHVNLFLFAKVVNQTSLSYLNLAS